MKCIDAFKNLNIALRYNNLKISPCCLSPTKEVASIDINDPYLESIRQTWLINEFPVECYSCKQAEEKMLPSRRVDSNQWYEANGYNNLDTELIRLDYWTGDTCNLACAICGPENSSQWKKELGFAKEDKHRVVNKFWKTIDISQLKFIHFNGGEPLLSKEHVEFLQSIQQKQDVHLNYNTNGTILPTKELLELWTQFKLVQIDFSIDDIGESFEYQRYPAKWDQVQLNLKWYINNAPINCMFAVNTTVSILNHKNLDNLNSWLATNFYTNRVTDPIEHRKQLAIGLFSLTDAEHRKNEIIKFLTACDTRRGTDWKKTFPHLLEPF